MNRGPPAPLGDVSCLGMLGLQVVEAGFCIFACEVGESEDTLTQAVLLPAWETLGCIISEADTTNCGRLMLANKALCFKLRVQEHAALLLPSGERKS